MKIGTDAVILGAWIRVPDQGNILDVGTGSGILALMMAQRAPHCIIEAIDIDEESVNQADKNFKYSRWKMRLKAAKADFTVFQSGVLHANYDLILSNPPFFTSVFKTRQARRNLARHTDTLPHETLINQSFRHLKSSGTFAVVIPYEQGEDFQKNACETGFSCHRKCAIIPVEGREANRVMLEFGKNPIEKPEHETIAIRLQDGSFTPAYRLLLKDFYLGLE